MTSYINWYCLINTNIFNSWGLWTFCMAPVSTEVCGSLPRLPSNQSLFPKESWHILQEPCFQGKTLAGSFFSLVPSKTQRRENGYGFLGEMERGQWLAHDGVLAVWGHPFPGKCGRFLFICSFVYFLSSISTEEVKSYIKLCVSAPMEWNNDTVYLFWIIYLFFVDFIQVPVNLIQIVQTYNRWCHLIRAVLSTSFHTVDT